MNGKVALRVFAATNAETDHHVVFLVDVAGREILELTEGS